MTPAERFFHPDAATAMRQAITAAGGNEVFFVGRRSPEFPVAEVEVLARGHASAVPAVLRAVRTGEVVLHNHPSGNLTPSEPDLGIAAGAGAQGIAFAIVDNAVTHAYVVVEPEAPREERPIDAAEIERMLGPAGPIAGKLPGYEHRAPQIAMARAVGEAFNHGRVVLIEAGTGTGKSLAYLLPAILHATRNRERVVVSTNTINLQEQLLGKDLPFLRDQLGLEFKSVLLKGRSNYLCLRKTAFALGQGDRLFDGAGRGALAALVEWSEKTADGSLADLPFDVPDAVWEEVASDSDDCMGVRSPHYGRCFFYRSRREAASADLIVVNHHLLMADLAARAASGNYTATAVLPPYDRLIIDEAHNLEDVASSFFGTAVTPLGLLKHLGRLCHERDESRGVLPALHARWDGHPDLEPLLADAIEERKNLALEVRARFEGIGRAALGLVGLDELGSEEIKVRLKPDVLTHPAFAEGVVPECEALVRRIGAYAALIERVRRQLGFEREEREDKDLDSALLRLQAVGGRLSAAAGSLAEFPRAPEDACHWLEARKSRRNETIVRLCSAPLAAGPLLARHVHERMRTVVMTSATLTVGGGFEHFRDRLGVSGVAAERTAVERFESPFDYARQALLLVPTDMPDPQEPSFAEAAREAVWEAVTRSQGRAFVLFTSYRLLGRTYQQLERRLREAGMSPLRQGEATRDRLVQRFRNEKAAVLFAVDSFWEGVDVPGEALSLVILVRLPFKVPSEPLQEARYEAVERAGGDPFLDFAVPQAVIKFRQGFGRLIRTRSDRGAVLVLDARVATRRYGQVFLSSLPPLRIVTRPRVEVLDALAAFFAPAPAVSSPRARR